MVEANCTSPPSNPVTNITWYMNDKQVSHRKVRQQFKDHCRVSWTVVGLLITNIRELSYVQYYFHSLNEPSCLAQYTPSPILSQPGPAQCPAVTMPSQVQLNTQLHAQLSTSNALFTPPEPHSLPSHIDIIPETKISKILIFLKKN